MLILLTQFKDNIKLIILTYNMQPINLPQG